MIPFILLGLAVFALAVGSKAATTQAGPQQTPAQIDALALGKADPATYAALNTAMNTGDVPTMRKIAYAVSAKYPALSAAIFQSVDKLLVTPDEAAFLKLLKQTDETIPNQSGGTAWAEAQVLKDKFPEAYASLQKAVLSRTVCALTEGIAGLQAYPRISLVLTKMRAQATPQ